MSTAEQRNPTRRRTLKHRPSSRPADRANRPPKRRVDAAAAAAMAAAAAASSTTKPVRRKRKAAISSSSESDRDSSDESSGAGSSSGSGSTYDSESGPDGSDSDSGADSAKTDTVAEKGAGTAAGTAKDPAAGMPPHADKPLGGDRVGGAGDRGSDVVSSSSRRAATPAVVVNASAAPAPASGGPRPHAAPLTDRRGKKLRFLIKDLDHMRVPVAFAKSFMTECTFRIDDADSGFIEAPNPKGRTDVYSDSDSDDDDDRSRSNLRLCMREMTDDKSTIVGFEYKPTSIQSAMPIPETFRVNVKQFAEALRFCGHRDMVHIYRYVEVPDKLYIEPRGHGKLTQCRRIVDIIADDTELGTMTQDEHDNMQNYFKVALQYPHKIQPSFAADQLTEELGVICAANPKCAEITVELRKHKNNHYLGIVSERSSLYQFCVFKRDDETSKAGSLQFSRSDAMQLQPPDFDSLDFEQMDVLMSMRYPADMLLTFMKSICGKKVMLGITPKRPLTVSFDANRDEFGVFKIIAMPKVDTDDE